MKKIEKLKKICPFWSSSGQTCKIRNEGLFIPLGDHIEVYCKGTEYPLCKQFALIEQAQIETRKAEQLVKGADRRHDPRIKSTHRLTFIRLSDSGHAICIQPSAASTLDLSSGGMRMTTRELLMHDSIIQFQFVAPFASTVQAGLAKVKWCMPAGNNPFYHAGLSFQSDHVIQAVDQYLGSKA
jgi:PilZ domain